MLGGFSLCTACVSSPVESDSDFCHQLSQYARKVPAGETRTVTLRRGGAWLVDHYKSCDRNEDDVAGTAFCTWLIENTSTEFMEANINLAVSCLQGHSIYGHIGNTGIEKWNGEMSFYSPNIDADVKVDLAYSVQYFDDASVEDFLRITVAANE